MSREPSDGSAAVSHHVCGAPAPLIVNVLIIHPVILLNKRNAPLWMSALCDVTRGTDASLTYSLASAPTPFESSLSLWEAQQSFSQEAVNSGLNALLSVLFCF